MVSTCFDKITEVLPELQTSVVNVDLNKIIVINECNFDYATNVHYLGKWLVGEVVYKADPCYEIHEFFKKLITFNVSEIGAEFRDSIEGRDQINSSGMGFPHFPIPDIFQWSGLTSEISSNVGSPAAKVLLDFLHRITFETQDMFPTVFWKKANGKQQVNCNSQNRPVDGMHCINNK